MSYAVVDAEGRIYGYYRSRESALAAAASAVRGFPWRRFRVTGGKAGS